MRTRVKPCIDADTSDSVTCDGGTPTDTESCNDGHCRKLENDYQRIIIRLIDIS